MMAALPVGSNALMFAQPHRQAEATAAIVVSDAGIRRRRRRCQLAALAHL
jgi:hypothetical protein